MELREGTGQTYWLFVVCNLKMCLITRRGSEIAAPASQIEVIVVFQLHMLGREVSIHDKGSTVFPSSSEILDPVFGEINSGLRTSRTEVC